jgi:hypothetical protein
MADDAGADWVGVAAFDELGAAGANAPGEGDAAAVV